MTSPLPSLTAPHSAAPPRWGRSWWLLAMVTLGSLGLRLAYVSQELREHSVDQIIRFNWDSREYVHLASNLIQLHRYVDDQASTIEDRRISHFFGLLRTPGYPVFLALFLKMTGTLAAALWAQAVLGSLIAPAVMLLGDALFRSRIVGPLAACLVAISPTGMGLSGIFLVDGLFTLCVVVSWLLLWMGIARGRWTWYAASGAATAVGVLFKPTLLYWPLALVPVAWLMGKALGRRISWRGVAVAAVLPLGAVALWSARNARTEGSFVYCIVDGQNLRHFLAPLVETTAQQRSTPTADEIWNAHFAARYRDWDDLVNGLLSPAQLGRRQRDESLRIFAAHPFITARCVVSNALSSGGWPYTRDELNRASLVKRIAQTVDSFWFVFWRSLGILAVLSGLAEPLCRDGGLSNPLNRRRFFSSLALVWTALYFLAAAGTSFSTGFRLLYPAEFALVLLSVSGAASLFRWMK